MQYPDLPVRGIYLRGNAAQYLPMTKKQPPITLNPVEKRRLDNARWLADHEGTIVAFAKRIGGRNPVQIQNTIGKTPLKRIGRELAPDIERAYGLQPGELDADWQGNGPPSWAGQKEEPASTALQGVGYDDNIEALQWVVGAIATALAGTLPDTAEAVELALLNNKVPGRFRKRGPVAAVLSGISEARLAALERPSAVPSEKIKGSRRNGPSKR